MEECLIEVVDPGVESADIGAHFLAERCDIGAYFLAEGYQHSQQGNARADDGNDDLGSVTHRSSVTHPALRLSGGPGSCSSLLNVQLVKEFGRVSDPWTVT